MKTTRRACLIDLLRLVLSFGVMLGHYRIFTNVGGAALNFSPEAQPFYAYLRYFYDFGGAYRVPLFWVISGFVLFLRYGDRIAAGSMTGFEFFVGRFARLYPLHIATLLLVALFSYLYISLNGVYFRHANNDLYHFCLQLFLASAWGFQDGFSFNGPVWSVSAEILVLLLFFPVLQNFGRPRKVAITVILVCALLHGGTLKSPVLDCLAFFHAGVLAASYSREPVAPLRILVMVLAMAAGVLLFNGLGMRLQENNTSFLLLLCFGPLLVFVLYNSPLTMPLAFQRLMEKSGRLTFSIYMLHFPTMFFMVLLASLFDVAIPYAESWFLLCYVGTTVLLSQVVYSVYEAPAQAYLTQRLAQRNRLKSA
ncbi:MAG: acyltransferase [Azonexus sp.]